MSFDEREVGDRLRRRRIRRETHFAPPLVYF